MAPVKPVSAPPRRQTNLHSGLKRGIISANDTAEKGSKQKCTSRSLVGDSGPYVTIYKAFNLRMAFVGAIRSEGPVPAL